MAIKLIVTKPKTETGRCLRSSQEIVQCLEKSPGGAAPPSTSASQAFPAHSYRLYTFKTKKEEPEKGKNPWGKNAGVEGRPAAWVCDLCASTGLHIQKGLSLV